MQNATGDIQCIIEQLAFANISIFDNGTLLYSMITDSSGLYNKQIIFNNTFKEGRHEFNLSVVYNGGSFTFRDSAIINITFDPTPFYGTTFYVEGVDIDSLSSNNYPVIQLLEDRLELSTYFYYNHSNNLSPISGASITITDSVAGVIDSGSTDGSGYYNFSVHYRRLKYLRKPVVQ